MNRMRLIVPVTAILASALLPASSVGLEREHGMAECISMQLQSMLSHDGKLSPTHTRSEAQLGSATSSASRKRPVSKVATFAMVPADDCEFRAIFHADKATKRDVDDIKRWNTSLGMLSEPVPATYRKGQGFASYVRNTDSDVVIVIGHNTDGKFYFPDGEALPLTEMANLCASNRKFGVFLSCESSRVLPKNGMNAGVNSVLTYDEALAIAGALKKSLANGRSVSYQDLAHEVPVIAQRTRRNMQTRCIVKYVVIGTVTGIVIYAIAQDLDDDKRKKRHRTSARPRGRPSPMLYSSWGVADGPGRTLHSM